MINFKKILQRGHFEYGIPSRGLRIQQIRSLLEFSTNEIQKKKKSDLASLKCDVTEMRGQWKETEHSHIFYTVSEQ